ncbi:MAG: ATP-binding cassette domain-containing protein [Methanomassiliicoccales archaeon]
MDDIITVDGLHKSFGKVKAVDGISFSLRKGEILGFLGPNGAGKTTTVRLVTGVLRPDGGRCVVAGHDPHREQTKAQRSIGIAPEVSNAYVELTAWQNMVLMGELYRVPREERESRAGELLEFFGLEERADSPVGQFSKGMGKRLNLAMSMMHRPSILFLDEPTSGLDVQSQRLIRKRVEDLNGEGVSVFLTTHNMEEANQLCHRIAVMSRGKIAAIDRPTELKRRMERTQAVEVSFADEMDLGTLSALEGVEQVHRKGDGYRMITPCPVPVARKVFDLADRQGTEVLSLQTMGPSLEDVFLSLTGGSS